MVDIQLSLSSYWFWKFLPGFGTVSIISRFGSDLVICC